MNKFKLKKVQHTKIPKLVLRMPDGTLLTDFEVVKEPKTKRVEFRAVLHLFGKHYYLPWVNYFRVPKFLTRRGPPVLGFIGGQVRIRFI